MRSSALVLALALSPAVAAFAPLPAASSMAWAAPIDLLPTGEVLGDGRTPVDLHVVAVDASGKPISGLKLKPEATAGTVGDWKEIQPGLYGFAWTPPSTANEQTVTVSAKGKGSDKAGVSVSRSIEVRAASSHALAASANPAAVVLGQTPEATVTLTGGTGELAIRASSGTVSAVTPMGDGRTVARFIAPRLNYPQLAILTMVDESGAGDASGWSVVPLQGAVDYPVEAPPNSTVLLKVAGREFGPRQANASGQATLPIVVPPGVSRATVVSVTNGVSSERPLDLSVPETRLVALYPMPASVPAGTRVPVRMVKLLPDGRPDTTATVGVAASGGTVEPATHEGNGVYATWWTAPLVAGQVTLETELGGSPVQKDALTVEVLPPAPASVKVSTDPAILPVGAGQIRVFAHIGGPDGSGLSGRPVSITAQGAKAVGTVKDLKNGDYQIVLAPEATGRVSVQVVALPPTSTNPLRHVVLVPASERVLANGARTVSLLVVGTDAYGNPVPNVAVSLGVEGGGGRVTPSVTTDATGIAFVEYVSGTEVGLATVTAKAGAARGATALLQLPADAPSLDLPVSGTASWVAMHKAWANAVSVTALAREGTAVAAAPSSGDTFVRPPAGPVDSFQIFTDPAKGVAGGSVVVRVTALDDKGTPSSGQTLDWLTSAGTLSPAVESGPGVYESTLQAPNGFTGEIKVSVVAPSGKMSLAKVNFGGAEAVAVAPAWGNTDRAPSAPTGPAPAETTTLTAAPAEEPKQAKAPKAEKPKKEPKPKSEGGDHPWVRAGAQFAGSTYTYEQAPSEDPGPVLPQPLSVGGEGGGTPAAPMGAQLGARAWFVDYFGASATFRSTWYAIQAANFNEPAPDWLYDADVSVHARYPFDVGDDQFWLGAKAGYRYNDFLLFTGCFDDGCIVSFEALGVHGLGVGGELGAEVGPFFLLGGYTHGLANFSTPYSSTVDVDLGWAFVEHVFADIGFTSSSRSVTLQGADSGLTRGEIRDSQLVFRGGVGVQF
jgi:hypothetical protein